VHYIKIFIINFNKFHQKLIIFNYQIIILNANILNNLKGLLFFNLYNILLAVGSIKYLLFYLKYLNLPIDIHLKLYFFSFKNN
jgi:hypothetical protein